MYERIIEIIVWVMSELRQTRSLTRVELDELYRRGYSSAEISAALSWLADKFEMDYPLMPLSKASTPGAFRVLHDVERESFTPEAWGFLVQMLQLGLLNMEHIEVLIERTTSMGFNQMQVEEVKVFAAMLLFQVQAQRDGAHRVALLPNDTIH